MNLRSKSKGKIVAPRAALKTGPTIPEAPDNVDFSEETLRKLSRAELQKVAMVHKVKANIKSELIIQQLLGLQIPKKRSAESDPEEGPSQKRFRGVVVPENQVALLSTPPATDTPVQPSVKNPRGPEDGPSAPQLIPPVHKEPSALPYDEDLFSGTSSEMTEEEQNDFDTPVSSRSGTPPAANVDDLIHCVTIMRQVSEQDVTLLKEVTSVRETAAELRKRARDVRDLVKAERGRRERMETYFRYWQEIEPTWDRRWLYGEKPAPPPKVGLQDSDKPSEPSAAPGGQQDLNSERPPQRPVLSPEEVKRKREAIISKQEAEQRQLEALQRQKGYSLPGPS